MPPETESPAATLSREGPERSWDVEVFFDGDCPLCRREIAFLRRRDRHRRILFTDIANPEFSAEAVGADEQSLLAEIHGRLPDGTWIRGVEVFRRLYGALGWSAFVAFTRLPVIAPMLDWGYSIFARHRLRLTGRCADGCKVPKSKLAASRLNTANPPELPPEESKQSADWPGSDRGT